MAGGPELPRAQKYYLAPPAANPSEDHIKAISWPLRLRGSTNSGKPLPATRRSTEIYLDLLEDFCRQETVIELIGPQMDKVDADGFLAEDYWSGSTHATPAYYDGVVGSLEL